MGVEALHRLAGDDGSGRDIFWRLASAETDGADALVRVDRIAPAIGRFGLELTVTRDETPERGWVPVTYGDLATFALRYTTPN